jgi:hypothetical protein
MCRIANEVCTHAIDWWPRTTNCLLIRALRSAGGRDFNSNKSKRRNVHGLAGGDAENRWRCWMHIREGGNTFALSLYQRRMVENSGCSMSYCHYMKSIARCKLFAGMQLYTQYPALFMQQQRSFSRGYCNILFPFSVSSSAPSIPYYNLIKCHGFFFSNKSRSTH